MKKHFIFTVQLVISISFYSFAQIPAGTWVLGGSYNMRGTQTLGNPSGAPASNNIDHTISVNTGIFVAQNLAIGLIPSLSFSSGNQKSSGISTQKSSSFGYGISPFIRKYKSLSEKWYFYVQATVSVTHQESDQSYNYDNNGIAGTQSSNENKRIGIGIAPGVTYFVNPKVALEVQFALLNFGINWNKNSQNSDNLLSPYSYSSNSKYLDYGLNANFSTINIGILFYFSKNKDI